MQKEKARKIKKSKSWLYIIGSLFILLGIVLIIITIAIPILKNSNERKALEQFYIKEEIINDVNYNHEQNNATNETNKNDFEYIAALKIPKISLEKGLVSKDSKYNNIEYGIQILNESDSPDVINGNVILAAHSGNSRISYFKNLNKLTLDDEVDIYYNSKIYVYKVVNVYDIDKTGIAQIKRNNNKSTLTLITCRYNTNKQIIIICELVN